MSLKDKKSMDHNDSGTKESKHYTFEDGQYFFEVNLIMKIEVKLKEKGLYQQISR